MPASRAGGSRPATAKRARIHVDADEDITPARKPRLRVSEACEPCRKRKDRCNGGKPTCDSCLRTRRECTYKRNRKRGLRTGYVRALELLLGLVFVTVGGSDDWLSSLLDGHAETPPFQARASKSLSIADSAEALLDAWRTSTVSKQVEIVLSTADTTEDMEGIEQVHAFDPKASQAAKTAAIVLPRQNPLIDDGPPALMSSPMNTEPEPPIHHMSTTPVARIPLSIGFSDIDHSLLSAQDTQTPIPIQEVCDSTGPAENFSATLPAKWEHLLEVYFAHLHCWLPLCEKHDLLRIAYLIAAPGNNSATPDGVTQGDRTFLMAVLDYSASLVAPRDGFAPLYTPQPTPTQTSLAAPLLSSPELGQQHYELGHIRALLILTISNLRARDLVGAWRAVGRAVYALTSLDSFALRPCRFESSANTGMDRTTLCCIALDTIVAASMQLRPYFQNSDITAVGSLGVEGMEEWESWKAPYTAKDQVASRPVPARILSTFNGFIEAVGILNDILRSTGGSQRLGEPAISDDEIVAWSSRLASVQNGVAEWNTTPHSINFRWFVTTLDLVLQQRQAPGVFPSDNSDTQKSLQDLGKVLRDCPNDIRGAIFPPTCAIYLSALRPLTSTGNEQVRIPRGLLSEFEQELHYLETSRNPCRAEQPHSSSRAEIERFSATDGHDGDCTDQENSMSTMGSLETQPTNVATMRGVDEPAPMALRNSPLSHAYSNPQTQMFTHPEPSCLAHMVPDMIDYVPKDTDEDTLFQRLTDLDSADWSANQPDFMKHLGVINDLPNDLDAFFNMNPI